jgi:ComF family protein
MKMTTLMDELLHLFFPATCPGCNVPLQSGEGLFCTLCSFDLPFARMHDETDNEVEMRFWGRCPLLAATAQFHFVPGGKVQHALHRLKYQGDKGTGKGLGKLLGWGLMESQRFRRMRCVLHVPLHPEKMKERGFDQARIIAQGVAETMGIPHYPNLIQRVSATSTQTRKGRYERWRNVSGAFRLGTIPGSFEGPALIVDDVLTTGSTLEACAQLLVRARLGPVAVAAVACA